MNDSNKFLLATTPDQSVASVTSYLVGLWQELLRVPIINPDDDFFGIGGDSALVIEMLVAVSAHFDREFKYNRFFPQPNIRTLSALIVEELQADHDQPCA